MSDFAQKIRLYKIKLDISNKELAERTGLPVTTISRICSGSTKNPTLNTVKLLAKAFDCSVEELLDYTNGVAPYFLDETTASLAQILKENKELKLLLETSKDLSPENLKFVIDLINTSDSIAEDLRKTTKLKLLLEVSKDLSSEDLRTVIEMVNMVKRNNSPKGAS